MLVIAKLLSSRGMAGAYQADYLTSTDPLIPERLVENSISERARTTMKLSLGLVTPGLDKQLHFGPFVLFSTQDISHCVLNIYLTFSVIRT